MAAANLAIRFVLELCLLAAFAYWGASAGNGPAADVALAVAAPAAAALVWGLFVAPRARIRLSRVSWIAVQVGLFVLGAAALWSSASAALGLALLVVFLVNLALLLRAGESPV